MTLCSHCIAVVPCEFAVVPCDFAVVPCAFAVVALTNYLQRSNLHFLLVTLSVRILTNYNNPALQLLYFFVTK